MLRLAVGFIAVATASAGAQPAATQAENGRNYALTLCSDCHLVARDQTNRPVHVQQIPSFMTIANAKGTTRSSLKHFIETTHSSMAQPGNMPTMAATGDQIDAIVAYILSLRRSH